MKLLLISGKKESGKTTFSNVVKEKDNSYIVLSFARKLKMASYYIMKYVLWCDVTLDHFYDVNRKKEAVKIFRIGPEITTRTFLQFFGTNIVRRIYELFWVALLVRDIKTKYKDKNIMIDDVRFPNEIEHTSDKLEDYFQIYKIRINRPLDYKDNHPSETALDDYEDFDYTLNNDGTLKEYQNKVKNLFKKISQE